MITMKTITIVVIIVVMTMKVILSMITILFEELLLIFIFISLFPSTLSWSRILTRWVSLHILNFVSISLLCLFLFFYLLFLFFYLSKRSSKNTKWKKCLAYDRLTDWLINWRLRRFLRSFISCSWFLTVFVCLFVCLFFGSNQTSCFFCQFCFFFLYFSFFLISVFPHHRLVLISQGTVLSRFVGGPMFQKFRRDNDPELGEVQIRWYLTHALHRLSPPLTVNQWL